MASSIRLFRVLVATSFVLHLLHWLLPFAAVWHPETFDIRLLELDGHGAIIEYHPVLYWCLLASWLLILSGLFFYVPAARVAFIGLVALSVVLGLAWGVRILAPWDAALGTLSAVIDGAVMVMAYWPSVHGEFLSRR